MNLTYSPSGDIIAATSNTSIFPLPLGMVRVKISNFLIPSKHFLTCLFTLNTSFELPNNSNKSSLDRK